MRGRWRGPGEGEEGGSGIGKLELKIALMIECLLCVKHQTTVFRVLSHFIFTTIVKSFFVLPKRKNVQELSFSLLWVQLRVESRAVY